MWIGILLAGARKSLSIIRLITSCIIVLMPVHRLLESEPLFPPNYIYY